ENVFIQGSRPQYLEDLHSEAQEGLKILQQEGPTTSHRKLRIRFYHLLPTQSLQSTDTLRPEQEVSSKDRVCSAESRSIAGNTDVTTASARPVLTRQGSTFKPLNSVKRSDKNKKRNRRTTIMGIPNQVQKELGINKRYPHHDQDEALTNSHSGVVMTSTDGENPAAKKGGARVHLSELEATKDEQLLKKHFEEMYRKEHPLDQRGFGSHHNHLNLRPKSVAVAGMSSSSSLSTSMLFNLLQEPQGPVMSISPQAAYLSTIIPNAVLPASVEVIEIDRRGSQTHGNTAKHGRSVCTVSKTSLTSTDSSVSPLLSRRSEADGSQTDNSQDSTTSISGSNRSKSESSKTLFSNSSPLSAAVTHGDNSPKEQQNREREGSESGLLGSVAAAEDEKTKQNFARSLSVLKTKQPPAPPRRTNSLHNNKIRCNGRMLVDGSMVTKEKIESVAKSDSTIPTRSIGSSLVDGSSSLVSPTSSSCTEGRAASQSTNSSPQKTLPEDSKFERTISPSSGYSSQSGTPTLSPKGIPPVSPDKQKKKPVKPERSVSRASSSAASPSSSLTSLSSSTSEPINQEVSRYTMSPTLPGAKELLDIPPPPKVKAPCPPPPEVWTHNRRCFDLLCGPSPNLSTAPQKPAKPLDIEYGMEKSEDASNQKLPTHAPPPVNPSPPPPSGESQGVEEDIHPADSSWPPPPPPLEGDSVFDGEDEVEFPPPPPPPFIDAPPAVDFTPVLKLEIPGSASAAAPPNSGPENENQTPSEPPGSSQILVTAPVSKELLCRHKSAPIPKEDANIPLVTPSLLQMVRLRSVSMAENNPNAIPGPQSTPQKPIRKSLSLRSPQLSGKTPTVMLNTPSLRLQEAIRLKTAAMSSKDGLPSLLSVRSSTQGCEQGAQSPRLPEGCDLHKSPASTASFIFSRSTKKVVIETAASSSPEAQSSLKQNLAAELMQLSDQSKVASNGRLKSDKVPPPVARKPTPGGIGSSPTHP
uniref:KIAA1522 n=1 Tax=Tetraodon nigroviridis TaxID=99883 RepID=H3CV17_TETNG